MKSKIYFVVQLTIFFLFFGKENLYAQPQHYNHLPTGNNNSFPFNINPGTGKKVQWLVAAGEFSQLTPAPLGNNITGIWFRAATAANATYTNLTVRMATVSASTFLGNGAFYSGPMTTVRSQNTALVSGGTLQWVSIPLTTPFFYDPAMNLIIEVSQCGFTGTGFSLPQLALGAAPNRRRAYSDAASPCGAVVLPTSGDQNVPGIGISVIPAVPCLIPSAQPTGLNLTAVSTTQINGSFTPASGAPTNYLVVRYPTGASPVNPVDGVSYTVGGSLGSGTVVSISSSTSFTTSGLIPATTYDFYVYSYNTGLCSATYLTSAPLVGSRATLPCSGPPAITCPANITVNNTPGQCFANVSYSAATATGDPTPVITYSIPSGSIFPVGTTNVIATATSLCGTTTCTFTITVVDNQGPVFSSPGLFPERLYYKFDGSGTSVPNLATAPPAGTATATLTGLTQGATGKCDGALVGTGTANQSLNTNWATNMAAPWTISLWLGPNQVDNNPSYLFGDVNAAAFRCFYGGAALPNNILLRGGSADVLITGVNPAATFITIVYNGINTVVYKNGGSPQTYNVTFSNTGAGPFRVGGYSTLASINGRMDEFGMYTRALTPAEVLNIYNTCPANINNCPANITVNNTPGACAAAVTYITPVALDNCAGVTTVQTTGLPSGSTFPVGTTTNSFRATDASGNITNCTFTVTVNDTQAPTISCPSNVTVSTPIGSCTAVVNYIVTATDNCPGVTVVTVPASGSTLPLGTTMVTSTATDAAGNTSTCSFTVTVLDGQLPVIAAPPVNRTVCLGTNATFSVTASNVVTYQWQQWNGSAWVNIAGTNSSSYTINNVTTAMNTNTFRVILNGLCTVITSTPASLYVNALPSIGLTVAAPSALLPAQTTTITATVNPPGGSFVWSVNGSPIPGVTGSVLGPLSVDDIGTYRAVYTDLNGCISTSSNIVVSGQASENLWVYPNPNQGQFTVRYYNQLNETLTLNIYSASGQKIYQKAFVTNTAYTGLEVNLGNSFSEGVYIVEVVNAAGKKVGAKRVVVRH